MNSFYADEEGAGTAANFRMEPTSPDIASRQNGKLKGKTGPSPEAVYAEVYAKTDIANS